MRVGAAVVALAMVVAPHAAGAAQSPLAQALDNAVGYNLTWLVAHDGVPTAAGDHNLVREQATIAYAYAVAHTTGDYDPSGADVPEVVALIDGLAASNVANGGWWGQKWGTGYITSLAARAAVMLGDITPPVLAMVAAEADHETSYPVRYFANRTGKVLTPGDSGAEEDAWDTALLATASRLLSGHPQWRARLALDRQAALTRPVDLAARPALGGWNIRNDGTLANHFVKVSAHYMAAAVALDGVRNADARVVYQRLTTYYESDGTVAGPYPDDWGIGYGEYVDVDAVMGNAHWLGVHVSKELAMQARFADGHTYAPGENKYPGAEQVVAGELASALLTTKGAMQ